MKIEALHRLSCLYRFPVLGKEGEIGELRDACFDSRRWVVRYLVAMVWELGREVLVSPLLVKKIDWADRRVVLPLFKEEIEAIPHPDLALPVTRGHEEKYNNYFCLPDYWLGGELWGHRRTVSEFALHLRIDQPALAQNGDSDSLLFRARHLRHFHAEGTGRPLGTVEDFLVNPESLAIRYAVLGLGEAAPAEEALAAPARGAGSGGAGRTAAALSAKRLATGREGPCAGAASAAGAASSETAEGTTPRWVLLPPRWLGAIDRESCSLAVRLSAAVMETAPSYSLGEPISPAYEKSLLAHYRTAREST